MPSRRVLTDDEFRAIVDRALRGEATEGDNRTLTGQLDRWWDVLSAMKKSVETQLAAKRDEVRAQRITRAGRRPNQNDVTEETAYAKWRAGAVRFKNIAEIEMVKVSRLRQARQPAVLLRMVADERNTWHERVRFLEQAIRDHRAQTQAINSDPASEEERNLKRLADGELWATLEQPTDPPQED